MNLARCLALFALAPALLAQWPNLPAKGIPRNPDGSPNLSASPPKTPQGKPDLSGTWLNDRNRPCPPYVCNDMEVSQEFMNIGWELKEGLPYQSWAADLVKKRTAENGVDDPGSHCRPTGLVKMHTSPFYRKIVQTPDLLLILTERDAEHRQIFLDGRKLPADPQPLPNGYSTATWDGDTLVVRSIGFPDGTWLDRSGSPLTNSASITERFRRPKFGQLEISITVEDSRAYTKPWTVTLHQHLAPDTELIHYYCMENEKDAPHLTGR